MKQSSFTLYYFVIGIIFIILERFFQLHYLETAVKALIIPSLIVYYHSVVRGRYNLFHRLMIAGLFFSWLGDIFLQLSSGDIRTPIPPENYFMAGMGSFLFTQFFYILAFNLKRGKNPVFRKRIYQLVLVIAYGGLILWLLYNNLEFYGVNYRLPVIIFTFFILLMLVSAMNRYSKVNGISYILVVTGALLFVASASMIVINKFLEKFDFARVLIMITYIAGQYLIATGCIKQDFPDED